MKTFYFIMQAKGGAGKSFLTYLMATKYRDNLNMLFLDADCSTATSSKQLKFLKGNLATVNLLDDQKKIARDKLFEVLEEMNRLEFQSFVLDFGAPESEQVPSLLTMDFSAQDFKDFEQHLSASFMFNIVIAGGTAYASCMDYLKSIYGASKNLFTIRLWVNKMTFEGFRHQLEEIQTVASKLKLQLYPFGDLNRSAITTAIVSNIEKGGSMDELDNFMARKKLGIETNCIEL